MSDRELEEKEGETLLLILLLLRVLPLERTHRPSDGPMDGRMDGTLEHSKKKDDDDDDFEIGSLY